MISKRLLAFLFLVSALCAAHAADAEKPPEQMIAHFHWCDKAKTPAGRLVRYEGFWEAHLPAEEDGYDDMPHVTFVRKAAYRLAALYAQTGKSKKCVEMLRWLEAHDDTLPDNVNPPKALQ